MIMLGDDDFNYNNAACGPGGAGQDKHHSTMSVPLNTNSIHLNILKSKTFVTFIQPSVDYDSVNSIST